MTEEKIDFAKLDEQSVDPAPGRFEIRLKSSGLKLDGLTYPTAAEAGAALDAIVHEDRHPQLEGELAIVSVIV